VGTLKNAKFFSVCFLRSYTTKKQTELGVHGAAKTQPPTRRSWQAYSRPVNQYPYQTVFHGLDCFCEAGDAHACSINRLEIPVGVVIEINAIPFLGIIKKWR
jgi:hypothetical protein